MMNITDEMAATDAKKFKAMRISIGWFSSPSFSLIYQCSKYVAMTRVRASSLATPTAPRPGCASAPTARR
eukprot:3981073-Pleurochrysis_carterae.AAC.1